MKPSPLKRQDRVRRRSAARDPVELLSVEEKEALVPYLAAISAMEPMSQPVAAYVERGSPEHLQRIEAARKSGLAVSEDVLLAFAPLNLFAMLYRMDTAATAKADIQLHTQGLPASLGVWRNARRLTAWARDNGDLLAPGALRELETREGADAFVVASAVWLYWNARELASTKGVGSRRRWTVPLIEALGKIEPFRHRPIRAVAELILGTGAGRQQPCRRLCAEYAGRLDDLADVLQVDSGFKGAKILSPAERPTVAVLLTDQERTVLERVGCNRP